MSSSTTTALSRQPLAQVLKNVEDPRDRRGVRHSLFAVLSQGVGKVGSGAWLGDELDGSFWAS